MGKSVHGRCLALFLRLNTVLLPITEGAEGLADTTNRLLERSNQAAKEVDNADEVLSIIKKIADQTNLLGLNAAIEAAIAGDKGFGVVQMKYESCPMKPSLPPKKFIILKWPPALN
ncbi:methyl-accepting chemotaxis protein [Bacillus sp. MMSF_3328]|uniref:methyl-accepting chemotaxis protein n=1 Tax=Bacillus sp. MMSF_3328 TaxID=3047080 RepID=UPI00273D6BA0|nr:methyl-accepting chemotaxis protein [Bacillus sp. MMSF_3328]